MTKPKPRAATPKTFVECKPGDQERARGALRPLITTARENAAYWRGVNTAYAERQTRAWDGIGRAARLAIRALKAAAKRGKES